MVRILQRRLAPFFFLVLACAGTTSCGSKDSPNPVAEPVSPLDPSAPHFGKTYAEWGSAWWTWYYQLQMPADGTCIDPILDATGEHCGYGQDAQSPVFFLTGDRGGKIERTKCIVPKGKAVLFPVLNSVSDNGGVPPAMQESDDQLRAFAQSGTDAAIVASFVVEIDGHAVPDLGKYKIDAAQFSYVVPPPPNSYSCGGVLFSGVVDPSFQSGYYILLPALSDGPHTIHFAGSTSGMQPFSLDVTQKITVQ